MKGIVLVIVLVAGCGSSGGSWVEQAVPAPSAVTAYRLWVSGDNDVWLGGSSIWHFDGSAWTETPPAVPTAIADFWGFGPSDVFAIGDARVLHWDGAAWADVPASTGVPFESLYRVWGASKNDLWIANTDNSRVYHYDGAMWTRTTLQFVQADALWGSSSSDIWLSGITSLYHFNGTTWAAYQGNDDPHGAYGLWGFGPNDVWEVGGFDQLSHWNGTTWTADQNDAGSYNSVWGSATNDVYAAGNNGIVSHFDGSSWSSSSELGVRENFTMVHGSSADNVWATSVDVAAFKAKVLRHEN
jgi:hypothetical protein